MSTTKPTPDWWITDRMPTPEEGEFCAGENGQYAVPCCPHHDGWTYESIWRIEREKLPWQTITEARRLERMGLCAPKAPKRRRFVRMFKPQFAPLVESGAKAQTVRPRPKRMPKPGDLISLREWEGKPYRSKQRVLREAQIVAVRQIRMDTFNVYIDESHLGDPGLEAFAKADGFEDSEALLDWFCDNHGLPFEGIVIYWDAALVLRCDQCRFQTWSAATMEDPYPHVWCSKGHWDGSPPSGITEDPWKDCPDYQPTTNLNRIGK